MTYTPKLPDEQVNIPKQHLLLQALKLFASVIFIAIVLYVFLSVSLKLAVGYISPQQEQELVKLSSFSGLPEVRPDPYLQSIVDMMLPCSDLPYAVKAGYISLGEVNAVALPGGMIGVTKEMFESVKNENELAFIIGHELAHFKHKDHLQGLGNGLILGVVSLLLGKDYGDFLGYSLRFTQAKFSQHIEEDADSYGLDLMQCAYGNVKHATGLLERINDGEHWAYFLESHPNFDARIEAMQNTIVEKGFSTEGKTIPLRNQVEDR